MCAPGLPSSNDLYQQAVLGNPMRASEGSALPAKTQPHLAFKKHVHTSSEPCPLRSPKLLPAGTPAKVEAQSLIEPLSPSQYTDSLAADDQQGSFSPARKQSEGATEEQVSFEHVQESLAALPDRVDVQESLAAVPARVVRGRVVVQLDDDEEPLSMNISEATFSGANSAGPQPESQDVTVEEALATVVEEAPPAAVTQKRGRQEATTPTNRERVMVDVEDVHFSFEDVHVLGGNCNRRPSSSDPPLVELRRRAGNCVVPSSSCGERCGLSKAEPTPCSLAGRFSECALCPRSQGKSGTGCGTAGPCAACNCGLKVIARNTFLTFAEHETENFGSRRRSQSEGEIGSQYEFQ